MRKKSDDTLHQIFINSIKDIDREVIDRFIYNAENHKPIDGNDAFDIALLLNALISGASRNVNMTAIMRKTLGMTRRRPHRLGDDAVRPGGVAWNIVERKVKGDITRAEGLREFEKLNSEVDPRTLKRWFDGLVPEVEDHVEAMRFGKCGK